MLDVYLFLYIFYHPPPSPSPSSFHPPSLFLIPPSKPQNPKTPKITTRLILTRSIISHALHAVLHHNQVVISAPVEGAVMKPMFGAFGVTASELQAQLSAGKLTSVYIVESYIAQIQAHNNCLNTVLEISPKAKELAAELDEERKRGSRRSPFAWYISVIEGSGNCL